jgi:RNA polymerase sigma factor (sigma-70 family)
MAEPEQGRGSTPIDSTTPGAQSPEPIPWDLAYDYARGIARRFCRGGFAHLEDDGVQEAMIRLIKNSGRIKASWKGFLRATLVNVMRDLLRREIESRDSARRGSEALEGARCSRLGVVELVALAELDDKLESVLAGLDGKFGTHTRAIVELRALDMSWEEVAKALGIPVRTCSFRARRAETWMRKQLSLPSRKGGDHE